MKNILNTHAILAAVILPLVSLDCFADSWLPPSVEVVASEDRNTLIRITPGRLRGPVAPATATILKYDPASSSYQKTSEFALRNPWRPHKALITNDGETIVTFDDYANLGRTTNVVVVYRGNGEVVKAWSLSDIFSEAEIKEFMHTVGSTWWMDSAVPAVLYENPDGRRRVTIYLRPPGRSGEAKPPGKRIILDLATLTFDKEPDLQR